MTHDKLKSEGLWLFHAVVMHGRIIRDHRVIPAIAVMSSFENHKGEIS